MTNTKTISLDDLRGLLKARVTQAVSLRACARELRVSPAYLSRILTTRHARIGPRVVKALGYKTIQVFQQLPPRKAAK